MAILSIEEAGKRAILRNFAIVPTEQDRIASWREYRDHKAKNVAAPILQYASQGAKTLYDLAPMFDPDSVHPIHVDVVKQLGFYTDCYGDAHWSEPPDVIDKDLAQTLLISARALSSGHAVSTREIELWIEHVGPEWNTSRMAAASINFYRALIAEGLSPYTLEEVEAFYSRRPDQTH